MELEFAKPPLRFRRTASNAARMGEAAASEPEPATGAASQRHDVHLRFDLLPGAYATMCLREAMKLEPPSRSLGHIRWS